MCVFSIRGESLPASSYICVCAVCVSIPSAALLTLSYLHYNLRENLDYNNLKKHA